MFTKVTAALCSAPLMAVLYAAPACAQQTGVPGENGVTVELGLSQGRLFPNYGIYIAPEKTVAEASVSYTHDRFTVAARSFTLATSKGTYGRRGLGDELQLEGTYSDAIHTSLGTFEYRGTATYRFLAAMQGLENTRDDYIELTGQVGYPIHFGESFTLTPSVGVDKAIPVGHNNPLWWEFGDLRLDGPFLGDTRFYLDYLSVHNGNSTTATRNKNTWSVGAGVSRQFWNGWTGTIGATYAQYSTRDRRFEYRPRRDGRLDPFLMPEKDWTDPGPKLFATLAYHF